MPISQQQVRPQHHIFNCTAMALSFAACRVKLCGPAYWLERVTELSSWAGAAPERPPPPSTIIFHTPLPLSCEDDE
jgi:hypothetical protein